MANRRTLSTLHEAWPWRVRSPVELWFFKMQHGVLALRWPSLARPSGADVHGSRAWIRTSAGFAHTPRKQEARWQPFCPQAILGQTQLALCPTAALFGGASVGLRASPEGRREAQDHTSSCC